MRRFLLLICLIGWSLPVLAQTATTGRAYMGDDGINVSQIATAGDAILTGGSFRGTMPIGDTILISNGEEDLFLCYEPPGDRAHLLFFGGSPLEEQLNGLAVAGDSALYLSGSFWETAVFGSDTLRATLNPKALFVMRRSLAGSLDWVQVLQGGRLKEAGTVALTPGGDLLVSGFFSDSLLVADTVLHSRSQTSAFALRFAPDGQLRWAHRWSGRGNVRGLQIACSATDDIIYLSGFYDDQLQTPDTLLRANTTDRDVFLMRLRSDGRAQWAERAGGVFDEEPTALAVDTAHHALLSGFLVGRMTLNGILDIESADGNDDFFILRYRPDGRIHWAYARGGDQLQAVTGVVTDGAAIYLTGRFQSNLAIDSLTATAQGVFDAFLLTMDTSGQFRQLWTIGSNDVLLPETLHPAPGGALLLGGTYRGTPESGIDRFLPARTIFSGFRLTLDFDPVTTVRPLSVGSRLWLYPNPAREQFRVDGLSPHALTSIIDEQGRIQQVFSRGTDIFRIATLTPGRYYLMVREAGTVRALPFIVVR